MTSRTAQREQARARRLADEQVRAERERRERRLRKVGGVVIAVVAVLVVAVAISSGSAKGGLQKGTAAAKTVAQVQSLLSGISQNGNRLGGPKSPVTVVYYGDLECPVCKAFTLNAFKQLLSNDVRAGRVQVVYRSLQSATRDQQTFAHQQVAALAAGEQQRMWNYVELFYHQQGAEGSGYVNEAYLQGLAKQVPGLDFNSWNNARGAASLSSQIASDAQQAAAVGASGTPTLVVKGPKGQAQPMSGNVDYGALEQAVKSVA